MTAMNSKKRVLALFRRDPIDTMPLFSGLSMLVLPALQEAGLLFSRIHQDAGLMARAALSSTRRMEFDGIVVPYDIAILSEALGNHVNFYEDTAEVVFPTVPQKIWKDLDEVRVPENVLERGRIPLVRKAVEIIRAEAPQYPVGVWQRGPFTQLGQLLELEEVLKATFKTKSKVEIALDKLTEMVIAVGRFWLEAGADYITLSEPSASGDVLPPRLFKSLIQPRLTRILDAWPSPKVLHIAGKTDALVEMMVDCGADALAVDKKNNLSETRVKIGSDRLLFGNFDVYDLPCKPETTVEQAESAIRGIIDAGVDAVWPGSDLWPDMRPENMAAMVRTVHEYGRRPTPAVGRL